MKLHDSIDMRQLDPDFRARLDDLSRARRARSALHDGLADETFVDPELQLPERLLPNPERNRQ